MKQEKLVAEISEYLHKDEVDFMHIAAKLGVAALPSIKKIISSDNRLAPKAVMLEQIIRLINPSTSKRAKERKQKFTTTMRSISTIHPDEHIKGFGPDMSKGRRLR